tara:strand:- start:508 stop:669 length:162 start_codon:yes stop_codon:yes gene_type:complete
LRGEAGKFITYWDTVIFKEIKLRKIKVKKLIFLLARIKRGCIFAAAKTAKIFS